MKSYSFFLSLVFLLVLMGCSFTETLVLQEDGSGRMSILLDVSESMSFGGDLPKEENNQELDTIISFKELFNEKRDSIALLSKEEQERLQKLENFNLRILMSFEKQQFLYDVFVDFKKVSEANNLFQGLEQSGALSSSSTTQKEEIIKVAFSFENNIFKRDAYIVDPTLHQIKLDSLKEMEMMLGEMMYALKYTFPRPIKTCSQQTAIFSLDRKTLHYKTAFLEYMKNPDLLNIEVSLEE
ncbi:MAG: hypothetical protein CVU03_07005 [Bacteroidetes bacterium HGW-Bacteroidetes-2]|jgi:hypothetical protein|nr:MAG: hypothetical protein CVU03_07005 [Bacteroidetes bacterium HGW-Bacteroidetes-2]